MKPSDYVSIAALIITYLGNLSGARVCYFIYKSKTSSHLSAIPFLAGMTCTALWLNYGIIKSEWTMISVNSVGFIFQLLYLAFFSLYSIKRKQILHQTSFTAIVQICLFIAIYTSHDTEFYAGTLASSSSCIACASTLATIQDVVKKKNTSSLPFPLILSSFLVSLSWLALGVLIEDKFLVLANTITTSISGAQLSLFLVYPPLAMYDKLSQSNKKSLDLIKLLKFDADNPDPLQYLEDHIDSNKDYTVILTTLMGQIYAKTERLSTSHGTTMVLLAYA